MSQSDAIFLTAEFSCHTLVNYIGFNSDVINDVTFVNSYKIKEGMIDNPLSLHALIDMRPL